MGLIVPQIVKVRTNSKTYKYYKEKGYEFEKCGDFIKVDVFDLHPGSTTKVKVVCDICGKESEMWYRTIVKCNKENKLITCGDKICKYKKLEDTCMKKYGTKCSLQSEEAKKKTKDTCMKRYGVDHHSKAQEIKDKKKNTCQLHFGADSPFGSKEIQNKSKKTWQKKYGKNIVNISQVKEIQDKKKKTWQKNYGEDITCPFQVESVKEKSKQTLKKNYGEDIENPFQAESVKEKSKQTMLNNYGVEYALQNEDIKNKVLDSFQFNATGPSSRAQRYINHILNGVLNKRICGSLADIYMEKENIIIEHDGRGHFLNDKMNGNTFPTKESLLREKQREDKIINNGYRMIRFIATKDRIPSDKVILNLIEEFKNSDFKVIRINFEEGTIEKDYKEKLCYDFGELRNITKEDLKKFEKQEKNISEN